MTKLSLFASPTCDFVTADREARNFSSKTPARPVPRRSDADTFGQPRRATDCIQVTKLD
jgi:hypothetical protein